MGAPAKFLFDVDFGAPDRSRDRVTPAEVAQQIAGAEARAYREGFEAAQREIGRQSEQALDRIAATLQIIGAGFSGIEMRMETEAVDVALSVGRKLCGELLAREPLAEIIALVRDCFTHLVSTPHIVVRINDKLFDAAREQIEALGKQTGFSGRLVILADPDTQFGDCKIEWADGGVVLERSAVEARINDLVKRYIASREQGAGARPEGVL